MCWRRVRRCRRATSACACSTTSRAFYDRLPAIAGCWYFSMISTGPIGARWYCCTICCAISAPIACLWSSRIARSSWTHTTHCIDALAEVIADPQPAQALAAGQHLVRGMAWSPHGVAHVEVSADGGAHWQPATLLDDLGPRSWRQFVWRWEAAAGEHLLASRATDLAGNIQPADVPFNQKGYLMNAIETVPVWLE